MTETNKFEGIIYGEPEKRVGERVGNYRLTRWLGRGAFANVYVGEHIYLNTQSAIKLLHMQLSEKALKQSLNEARAIAQLDHPHIVRVLDYGDESGNPFLVMAYAPNGSLRQRFPEGTRLSLEQVVPMVQQMASALDYAHQQRLIHRDVKPENMLLGVQDQVLLSDFGFVQVAQGMHTQVANAMVGTILYMAPEQLEGKVHFASDQYALGVVTYEWLCGECPFIGSYIQVGSQHMLVPPPSLCERVPSLPLAVEGVVFKALAKNRAQRYENVTAFANALRDASKDASSVPVTIFASQLPSSSSKTSLQPTEETSRLLAETLLRPVEIAETLPLPEVVKLTQPSQSSRKIRRTVLVLLVVVSMIAASVRLWYNITFSHALTYYTLSATIDKSPTSSHISTYYTASATVKNDPTSKVKGSATVIANASPTETVSRGTPNATTSSVPSTSPISSPLSTPASTAPTSYEAEAPGNTLTGSARVVSCSGCSGGKAVGPIGSSGYTLQFNNISENQTGSYTLTIYYINGSQSNLDMMVKVNGGDQQQFSVAPTGSWNTVSTITDTVSLNAGNNTITLSGVPGFDRIVV